MSAKNDALVVVGVGVAVLLVAYYVKTKLGDAADAAANLAKDAWTAAADATKYVNPTSTDNLAYQGSSGLARWLTGQSDGTLGTIIYDYAHKGDVVDGKVMYYTPEQQAADLAAQRRLENVRGGM